MVAKAQSKPFFKEVSVTPLLANVMLKKMGINRKSSVQYEKRLAATMDRPGEWLQNGDTIKVDKKGYLLDGQQRLRAIILHGKPVKLFIAYNVERKAFKTIDIGRKRTPADMLSIQGEKDCNVLASVLRTYNSYREKNLNSLTCNKSYISPTETETILRENPNIRESVRFAAQHKKKSQLLMPPSICATFHFIFGKKSKKNRDIFFEDLLTGASLSKASPIFILRQILLERRVRYSTKDKPELSCLMIKAWNNKFGGKRVDLVYKKLEKMPVLLG